MKKQALIRAIVSMVAIGLLAIGVGRELSAAEVTPEMASRAVKNWRATREPLGCKFGRQVAAARRCEAGGAKFNVVKMEGGGFVVTSADTGVRPILFFSDGEDLDEDPRNPLYALVKQDMRRAAEAAAKRRAGGATLASVKPSGTGGGGSTTNDVERVCESQWAELLEPDTATLAAVSKPSDVRVDMLVQSQWSQSTVSGGNCYNYYTPNNYVCGCVATAMGQIMRYFQYPTASMAQFSNPYCKVSGTQTELTSMGGTYDWANIPLKPRYSTNSTQRKAVGKLCYDAGVAVSMGYSSGGSGSNVFVVPWALINRFGYRGALAALWSDGNSETSLERTRRAMITNFDAGLPMEIGISGDGGHAIVADGYGYSNGSFCCHLNFGWHGSDDGWYIPPSLGDYNLIDELAYNIFPTQDPSCAIVSGRVLSNTGSAASGVTVNAVQNNSTKATATTNNKGIFALFVKPGTYSINAKSGNYEASVTAKPTALKGLSIVITDGNPTRSYWTGNRNAEICNVHVGDVRLQLPNVAYIGDTGYSTLAAACNAAAAGQTVKLERDVTENVTVKTACTVDFQGHTMNGIVFCTYNTAGGTVTLKNGTVTGNNDSFDGQPGSQDVFPNGQVTFENMTMTGTIWSDSHPLVFTSGTYSGAVRSGSTAVTINGGNFANLTKDGAANFVVNGGAFAANFSSVSTIPAGYIWKQSGSGTCPWSVALDAVAKVGTTEYASLQAACTAATAGQTVTLVKDTSENVTLSAAAVVDLGGKTLTGTFTFANGADTATLKNGTLSGSIAGGAGSGAIALENLTVFGAVAPGAHPAMFTSGTYNGNVTLAGAAATFASGTYAGTVTVGSAAATINGGSFKTLAKSGDVKFTVNGGHFGGDFSSVCMLPTYVKLMNDGAVSGYPWSVVERRIARIGDNDYFSFADACGAAKSGETVVLLVDNNERVTVLKSGIVDLGGKTFSGVLSCTNAASSTVSVYHGTVSSSGSVVNVGKGIVAVSNDCTVALLKGEGTGMLRVYGNAKATRVLEQNTASIQIYGGEVGTIEGRTVTVNDGTVGTITASGKVEVKAGTVTSVSSSNAVAISGGTVGTVVDSGTAISSVANATVGSYTYRGTGKLTVVSGKFGAFSAAPSGDKAGVAIRDGHFAALPVGEYQLDAGKRWVYDNSDPDYPLTPGVGLAQVGQFAYRTLAEALAVVEVDDTVTLLENANEERVVIRKGCTVDLDGKVFVGELVCTNPVSSTVTFVGGSVTGTVFNVGKGSVALTNNCAVSLLQGESTGMLKILAGGAAARVVQNGTGTISVTGGQAGSVEGKAITVAGGEVESVVASGAVTVNSGSISHLEYTSALRLNGGTVESVVGSGNLATMVVGGTVGSFVYRGSGKMVVSGGFFGTLTVEPGSSAVDIKGGRFKNLPEGEVSLPDGAFWVYDASNQEYPWAPGTVAVARVGSTTAYSTLAKACESVKTGDTVTLLVDADEPLAVVGKGSTIDLGGKTFTGELVCTNPVSSTVTLINGTVSGSVANNGKGIAAVSEECTVALLRGDGTGQLKVLEGGASTRVVQNGTGLITVSGGTVGSVEGNTVTVSGGEVGSIAASGMVRITAGTVSSLSYSASMLLTGGTVGSVTGTGNAVSSVANATVDSFTYSGSGKLTVTSGWFGSFTVEPGGGEVIMKGGRFKNRPEGEMTLNAGMSWVYDASDSKYPWIQASGAQARIGDVDYLTFAAANTASKSGETVTLLVDGNAENVTVRKNITVDLGGFAFAGELNCSPIKTATVTLANGVLGPLRSAGAGRLVVRENCTIASFVHSGTGPVEIEGGRFGAFDVVSGSGEVSIRGGLFKAMPTGEVTLPEGKRWECVEGEEYPWRLADAPPPAPPGPTPEEAMAKLKSGEVKMSVRQEPIGFVLRVEHAESGLWYGFWGADQLSGPFTIMPETFREGNGEAMEIVAPPRKGDRGFYKIGICVQKP